MKLNDANQLISKLAMLLHKEDGSDIILNANTHPAVKIHGKIRYIKDVEITSEDIEELAKSLLSKGQWESFEKSNELNLMLEYPGIAHFRVNVFKQRGEVGMVLRLIPLEVPSLEKLKLPDLLKDFAMLKRGIILFSGATGVGKSTSLASMIDYRNARRADHIVTIEDPIEFLHANNKSMITQREVGIDTDSYRAAMKSALRQAPDVVLVGEIRDEEVMQQALAFAETGHLVFATIHATSSKLTLERIINLFPSERRDQLMLDLSGNLQAIVTQRLLMKADGKGRIPAIEVMSNTPHIQQLIREARFEELSESMSRSTLKEGVITIDNYIYDLYEKAEITYEEALLYVDSPNNFRVRLRSDSQKDLPEELKSETNEWHVERPASDESRQKTWGNFSKDV